ncbi:hypothetical protein SALWKB29_1292 [Snodgrassella communis]|uniref:Uncharacterized protein n=1 Tax=Snodgrassella communis TaxID=2946699 RepID=A0A836MPI5_9NEIS|nr:hypothetical protein SALWKB29_2242 [Snodgrassella communis]KDN14673.1 hypothetical protein SALWKB29_1132 [Snodgrassella communis]KDN14833.1 hypothetical protein SALWKB29_1292 [Snodgrassella communis]
MLPALDEFAIVVVDAVADDVQAAAVDFSAVAQAVLVADV